MSTKLGPIHINEHAWYYESPRSIELIYEIRDANSGQYIRTDHIRIPLSKLEQSVRRMKRAKR